jgi:DNA polymerase-3 subunit epsilon
MSTLSFVSLDIETATSNSASICQIGYVVVLNGHIVKEKCILVQPPSNEYDARHSCIHGVDALQTKNEPTFPDIWEQIKADLTEYCLIMHNSSFDLSVLNSTLDYYGLSKPNFNSECTYKLTGLSLKALSESLQISMVKHHDPLSDAKTCALAYLKLALGEKPNYDLITNEKSDPFAGHERLSGDILKPKKEVKDPCNPFYMKKVVFTGVLQTMTRDQAANIVQELGADIDTSVNKKTNFVIVGQGAGPSKLKKIDEYNATGSSIRILNETEFVSKLKNGL